MNVKRFLIIVGLTVGTFGGFAAPASATVDHCPDHEVFPKVQDPSGEHVPTAGSEICIKAGTQNTDRFIADGATTLRDYLKGAGIVGGDGEGRDPSYTVLYHYEPPTPPVDEPPVDETTTTTTTTTVPPIVEDPLVEAPHIVCIGENGFTFKTDQPCPEPSVADQNDAVAAPVTELAFGGTNWAWPLGLAGLALVIGGGLLRLATKR